MGHFLVWLPENCIKVSFSFMTDERFGS